MKRTRALAVSLVALLWSSLLASPARADSACPARDCERGAVTAPDGQHIAFDVVLPPGYATSGRRYPVVYLLQGGLENQDAWLVGTPVLGQASLLGFMQGLPAQQQAIVVLPYAGTVGWYTDWLNGDHYYETAHIKQLLPYVDAHYRTIGDRAHRAIAGLSMGGYGAMEYASRHPDLFVAAGTFSAPVANTDPVWEAIVSGAIPGVSLGCHLANGSEPVGVCFGDAPPLRDVTAPTPWGNPVTDAGVWHGHDPTTLAANLRGVSLFLASGNGVPCSAGDLNPVLSAEALFYRSTHEFGAALTRAGIPFRTSYPACGVHDFANWMQRLREWWPQMIGALGTPAPAAFSYKSTELTFSVWGWTVRADAQRAVEFLRLTGASAQGVTLTGSGRTTVTTGTLFSPGEVVALSGASAPSAIADSAGRLTFSVDLGVAHAVEQYTPQGLVAARHPGYFTTKVVRFGQ